MSLPKNVSDIAKQFYKRADEEKALRGKNTEAIVACCVFIACRQAKVPRTFKEIGQLSHVPKKQLGTTFRALEQVFNFHHQNGLSAKTSPEDLVPRYCNHLNLPAHVQNFCVDVILNAREHSIANGRSPVSLAGAAVYFTTCLLDKPKQMKEISRVAGVSEGTIKLVYRIMYQEREKLVDPEWITSGRADLSRLPPADAPPAGK
jgi:transcription initiation factor TFIIB